MRPVGRDVDVTNAALSRITFKSIQVGVMGLFNGCVLSRGHYHQLEVSGVKTNRNSVAVAAVHHMAATAM
jgi:hypothetical protein